MPNTENFNNLCPDKAIADEYIIEGAMVAYCNIKMLNSPYLVRHIHNDEIMIILFQIIKKIG